MESSSSKARSVVRLPATLDFFGCSTAAAPTPQEEIPAPPSPEEEPSTKKKQQQKKKWRAEELGALRRRLRLRVDGDEVPAPWTTWDDLEAAAGATRRVRALRGAIEASRWTEPTAVQMQAAPALFAHRDVVACAPTGSGKTGAFLIPIAAALQRALILAPTRELCAQLRREAERFFVEACDVVVVVTPRDVLREETQNLGSFAFVVVDEADKLLDVEDASRVAAVDRVFSRGGGAPPTKALFSATFSASVRELADQALAASRLVVTVLPAHVDDRVAQRLVFVGENKNKLRTVRELLTAGDLKPPCLVFAQDVKRCALVARELALDGLRAAALGGGDDERALRSFRSGAVWFLVATNLASRGLDFRALNSVLNFDCPRNATDYLHRVGRVGRAGREGSAVTLFTDADLPAMRAVANVASRTSSSKQDVPAWLLRLPKLKERKRRSSHDDDDEQFDDDDVSSSRKSATSRTPRPTKAAGKKRQRATSENDDDHENDGGKQRQRRRDNKTESPPVAADEKPSTTTTAKEGDRSRRRPRIASGSKLALVEKLRAKKKRWREAACGDH